MAVVDVTVFEGAGEGDPVDPDEEVKTEVPLAATVAKFNFWSFAPQTPTPTVPNKVFVKGVYSLPEEEGFGLLEGKG